MQVHLPKRKTLYIASVYRPPVSSLSAAAFVSNLEVAMDNLHASSKRSLCVIAGDFNARNSLWWSGQDSNEAGLLLANCAAAHGFVQTVEGPTHAVNEPAASQLDLIFVNDISFVDSCEVLSPFSDHSPTAFSLHLRRPQQPRRRHEVLDFNSADLCGLNLFLAEADWSPVLECSDVEHALESWSETVQCAVSQFDLKTVFTARPGNKPWYSSLLHKLRPQKERLFRHA